MLRTLFAGVCLLSLLVGSAAAVVAVQSRRAGHVRGQRSGVWGLGVRGELGSADS
jgi:hypothetical protein